MHELSLSSAVLGTAVRHAQGRRVTAIELTVGALRQVVPESLEFYFGFVARGTVCEGAALRQRLVEARLRCRSCETEWPIDVPVFRCPSCAGEAEVAAGDEFLVESIQVTEEPMEVAACTARR